VAKTFVTAGGRPVEIAVFVEPGKEGRAAYALDALERSMRWDERVFGREYDLDVFNVVAVSDFNMGAMENKGLNIFNDKYVLASPETATDADYAAIEAIVAHEYFHNWSGNRVTCRDWFQLCLKEGLTVFRDQEFSSDERSRPVHRIAEVRQLRARQFTEDAGPLAHPVRPAEYREINNFYTATVYEKGAEVVRMLKVLIGDEAFRRGMDLYFERCDGTAATVEDFLQSFADVTGRDLFHFARWYAQAGTPLVGVSGDYDEAAGTYRLDFTQKIPPTPGHTDKEPAVIPVALGLVAPGHRGPVGRSDRVSSDGVFVLDRAADSILFSDVQPGTVPSVFRGFSAPVKVKLELSDHQLLTLLRDDADPFNRWQAAQTVAMRFLVRRSASPDAPLGPAEDLVSALGAFLDGEALRDPAFAALILAMPGETEIAGEIGANVDPEAVHRAREVLRERLGRRLGDHLLRLRAATDTGEAYSPDAASAGRRSLRNVALDLLAAGDRSAGETLACEQYAAAANMTDRIAALATLSLISGDAREHALRSFAERYRDEPLILDKWFGLQAAIPEAGTLDRVRRLMAHPAFSLANPNRVRSLVGSFALGNPTQFHRADGAGYDFLADLALELDGANPQLAARLVTAFGTWKILEAGRRGKAETALRHLADAPRLSPDVGDLVQRSLA
jgi:aminopeptidase N